MPVQCDTDGNFPTRTPYPTPSLIPILIPTLDFTPFYDNPTAIIHVEATNTAWYEAQTATAEAGD